MERQSKTSILGKPWLWIGASATLAVGVVWSVLRSSADEKAVDEKADEWSMARGASSVEPQAPLSIEVPLEFYNSHLAHLRFAADGHTTLAFGGEGTAMRSTDDGQTWQVVKMPTRQFLVASVVEPRSAAIIVVGTRGTILRSDDLGQNFVPVRVDTERSFRALSMAADGSRILAVGDEGMAYASRDGGRSFVAENTRTPNYLSQVVALPKRARFVAGGDNGALLLQDEGAGWRAITTPAAGMLMSLSVLSDGKLFAGTQNGLVLSSQDDGETWREVYKTNSDSFVADFESNELGSVLAARMRRGELLVSTDSGKTFESASLDAKQRVATLTWRRGHGFIGLGATGSVLGSDETGKRWSVEPATLLAMPVSMAIHPLTQTVLVVGRSGVVARSIDGGKRYQITRPGLGGVLRGFADNSSTGCLVAVGDDATAVHSLDAGKTWKRVPLGLASKVDLTSVTVEPKTHALIAAGTAATLLRSSDCGRTWVAIPGAKSDVGFLLAGKGSSVFALAAKSPVLRSTDAGKRFAPVEMEGDATLERAVAVSATDVIAVGEKGRIYRSVDDGQSFQRVASGTEVTLRAVSYDSVHRALWAVGDEGMVLCSKDGGATWKRVVVPTQENLFVIGVHPDGGVIWFGGNRGTAIRSSDGGENFKSVTSGSTQTILVAEFDPVSKEFVLAGAGGTLLRSVGGSRLSNVEANFNGRIDTALFHAPSGALFLGGDRLIRMGG